MPVKVVVSNEVSTLIPARRQGSWSAYCMACGRPKGRKGKVRTNIDHPGGNVNSSPQNRIRNSHQHARQRSRDRMLKVQHESVLRGVPEANVRRSRALDTRR